MGWSAGAVHGSGQKDMELGEPIGDGDEEDSWES